MDIIFTVIREDTFWKILLSVHFMLALILLAALTLQVVTALMPARQVAGGFVDRGPIPAASYATLIAVVYLLQALMGAWIYIKYRSSNGGTPLLVDGRRLRFQRAYRSNGRWPPSSVLVFLAAARVNGTCGRAQVADRFPNLRRVVRTQHRPCCQLFSRGWIMTQT